MLRQMLVALVAGFMLLAWSAPPAAAGRPWKKYWNVCKRPDRNPSAAIRACTKLIGGRKRWRWTRETMATLYFKRAYAYGELGEYRKAIRDYTRSLKYDPKDPFAYDNRAWAHEQLDEWDAVIRDASRALKYKKWYLPYARIGLAWLNKGDLDKAMANLTKAIELNPKYAIAYNNRGNAWSDKGEYDKAIADYNRAIELKPDYAFAYNNRGNAWDDKGEYDKAIADFTKAIELKPDYAFAYNNRGNAWKHKGEYDRAITDYNKAIELDPGYTAAYVNRALAYESLKKFDLARADYEKALSIPAKYDNGEWAHKTAREHLALLESGYLACKKKSGDEAIAACTRFLESEDGKKDGKRRARAFFFRGWEYRRKNELEKAIADLERAIDLDPRLRKAYIELAQIREFRREPEKALAILEKYTIVNPSDSAGWEALADLQMRLKKHDEAVLNYRRAASAAQSARRKRDRLVDVGHAYLRKKDAEGLLRSVREILKVSPFKPDFHALYHRALAFIIQEKIPEARKQLKEIIRLAGEKPEAFEADRFRRLARNKLADVPRHWRAWRLFKAGKHEQALESINAFLKENPDDIEALRFRARIHEKLGQPDKALADYEQITILRPQDAGAWKDLAEMFYRQEKMEQAIRNISRAIALEPENADLLNERAWYQVVSGKGEKGLADIDKALKIAPNNVAAIDTHAHVLAALGRDDEARAEFEKGFAQGVKAALSYLVYARLLLEKGEKKKAREYLRKAADFKARLWEDKKAVAEARALLKELEQETQANLGPTPIIKPPEAIKTRPEMAGARPAAANATK